MVNWLHNVLVPWRLWAFTVFLVQPELYIKSKLGSTPDSGSWKLVSCMWFSSIAPAVSGVLLVTLYPEKMIIVLGILSIPVWSASTLASIFPFLWWLWGTSLAVLGLVGRRRGIRVIGPALGMPLVFPSCGIILFIVAFASLLRSAVARLKRMLIG